jgi:hypothetical protein
MNRVVWALALTCLVAVVALVGRGASSWSTARADEIPVRLEPTTAPVVKVQAGAGAADAHGESPGFDPAAATRPPASQPSPAPEPASKPGCNAIPFVLPLIGVLFLLWLRMKKTMK